ncbi:ABC transporter ATP-binding protein [Candidatus Wolfebacteria bacterium CG_4_10_14_0_8_um_filter_37_11]|uniref:ABC transporter ATP-binding protein n=1 Tax=Candidatus Wolfebacteria bacterium CG_4_10_14_0_8_um_filter_37_11 TaxID=1975062 RepID=A0A2M7Q845_9BACT|nr:MAG: ABC transporter ATP-binding protein [Candidatus Wolfebacteria bacterium CG_4_10_14_0_8_um_filter_37_11]
MILSVKNLEVEINGTKILEDINFEINKGDALAIIGPNGAGKTMLLRALLDLDDYKGEIKWAPEIKIGYVPQRMDIETDIPLTVREFFYLRDAEINEIKIKEALTFVHFDEKILNSGFGEISVGQRQRVLVAWAIITKPDVLLFDEPTADVDIVGQKSIYAMLHKLQHDLNLTVILVSHDLNVVYKYADKVICLNRKKICEGAPNEILNTERLLEIYGGEKAFYHHQH